MRDALDKLIIIGIFTAALILVVVGAWQVINVKNADIAYLSSQLPGNETFGMPVDMMLTIKESSYQLGFKDGYLQGMDAASNTTPQIIYHHTENITLKEIEVRLPEYHLRDFRSVEEFKDILYDASALMPFDFGDSSPPDCDNYARQAQHYAGSQGIFLCWQVIDRDGYARIFGEGVRDLEGRHAVVMGVINNEIYWADYFPPAFLEDNTIAVPHYWLTADGGPVD